MREAGLPMGATPLSVGAVCMLLWLGPAGGASAQDRDPDTKIAGGGALPTGWHARTDKNRPLADATITQNNNTRHPEAYGLFIGGSHLADAQNRYTYFLVRGDGKFLVKRRVAGDSTAVVTPDWTDNDAVVKADSAGQATNELSISVRGGTVTFQVNGKDVYSAPAARLDTRGIVGYRVNHNLAVHLSALGVHKL